MSAIGAQPKSTHNGVADLFSGTGRSQVCGPNDPTGEARATVRTPGEEFNKRFDDMVDELPLLSDGGKEGVHALTDTAVSGWAAGKDGHYLKASGLLMLSVLQVVQPETKGASPLIRGAEEGLSAANTAKGVGYRSFSAFKRAEGVAGEGQAWHHVVEQTRGNVERFGAEAIHNTENLVQLPHGPGTIHNQISGFYSSKQPFTGGQTVRQWLSPQSFEQQTEFGRSAIQQFGGKP